MPGPEQPQVDERVGQRALPADEEHPEAGAGHDRGDGGRPRAVLGELLEAVDHWQVPWLVRPLPPAVLASAGMMELFGHGQDIVDALGVHRKPTDRVRYLVAFAVRTWDFGYLARGMTPPDEQFRFELTAPSGALWEFDPADAAQRITGPAVDFCLLVTRVDGPFHQ